MTVFARSMNYWIAYFPVVSEEPPKKIIVRVACPEHPIVGDDAVCSILKSVDDRPSYEKSVLVLSDISLKVIRLVNRILAVLIDIKRQMFSKIETSRMRRKRRPDARASPGPPATVGVRQDHCPTATGHY